MVPVTAFFAGFMGLWFVGLSVYVIRGRQFYRVAIGDGGEKLMARRIRIHGNFAEYIPFSLLLMGVNELQGSSSGFLVLVGLMLVLGRIFHMYGLIVTEVRKQDDIRFRKLGMGLTLTAIFILALAAIF